MNRDDGKDLVVSGALWPLSMILIVVAALVPVGNEFRLDDVFASPGTETHWVTGLGVAVVLLAWLFTWSSPGIVIAISTWICLYLAVWVGLAFNIGAWEGAPSGLQFS